MNKFDERYEFRFARLDECDRIMKWIDEHYQKGHILSKNKELFLYEYAEKNQLNIFLAVNKESKEIEATNGTCYSTSNKHIRDVGGSIFCASKNAMPLLGLELIKRLYQIDNYRYVIGNGSGENTLFLLKKVFKRHIGKLKHFYILNPVFKQKDFLIAKINEIIQAKNIANLETKHSNVIEIKNIQELQNNNCEYIFENLIPIKDFWYIQKRFFEHPIYKYKVYTIKVQNKIKSIFVMRKQKHNGNIVWRIVEFIGDQTSFVYAQNFLYSLFDKNTEYIDFYVYGFDDQILQNTGFIENNENSKNIIPDHFAPFEAKNIEIWFNSPVLENLLICKSWGDQDRPN